MRLVAVAAQASSGGCDSGNYDTQKSSYASPLDRSGIGGAAALVAEPWNDMALGARSRCSDANLHSISWANLGFGRGLRCLFSLRVQEFLGSGVCGGCLGGRGIGRAGRRVWLTRIVVRALGAGAGVCNGDVGGLGDLMGGVDGIGIAHLVLAGGKALHRLVAMAGGHELMVGVEELEVVVAGVFEVAGAREAHGALVVALDLGGDEVVCRAPGSWLVEGQVLGIEDLAHLEIDHLVGVYDRAVVPSGGVGVLGPDVAAVRQDVDGIAKVLDGIESIFELDVELAVGIEHVAHNPAVGELEIRVGERL